MHRASEMGTLPPLSILDGLVLPPVPVGNPIR